MGQRGRGIDLPSDRKWTVKLEPFENQDERRFPVRLNMFFLSVELFQTRSKYAGGYRRVDTSLPPRKLQTPVNVQEYRVCTCLRQVGS